jgi:8-oxo-dGTP diphosphatase
VPTRYQEPAEWYAGLPTVYAAACVLFTDAEDRVLLVKPNYRPYWAIPGGIAEAGESPHACAAREIREELGLAAEVGDLLVVSWLPLLDPRPRPMVVFVFDGGLIADPDSVRPHDDELDGCRFWPWEEAGGKLPPHTAPHLDAARQARAGRRTVYHAPPGPDGQGR